MRREAIPRLVYDGADISRDVTPFLLELTYRDTAGRDASDELSMQFQDVPGLWRSEWLPDIGAKVKASLQLANWAGSDDAPRLDCGAFEVDSFGSKGPPNTFDMKAVAIGATSSIRREERTKAWVDFSVSRIQSEIAKRHGFHTFFDSGYDPIVGRFDQRSESDLAFLGRVCEYAGLSLKATDGKIVIFQGERFDAQAPALTISRERDCIGSWSFDAASSDIYSACEVVYLDSNTRTMQTYLFKPDGISGTKGKGVKEPKIGKTLKLNRRCSSKAEAEAVARAALRGKNSREVQGSVAVFGTPALASGLTIAVEGFGRWDSAIYAIEESTHTYSKSGGYTTAVNLRGVLGY